MGGRGAEAEVVSGFDRAEPIESDNGDLRCLCIVFTRARAVLAVGGRMESSRSHNAGSTASTSKPLVSFSFQCFGALGRRRQTRCNNDVWRWHGCSLCLNCEGMGGAWLG